MILIVVIAALFPMLAACDSPVRTDSGIPVPKTVVAEGSAVKVHYVLTVDGDVYENTRDSKPLEFTVGSNQVIPGFEKALVGMSAGEKKSFSIPPEEGFGPEYPNAIRTIPAAQLPSAEKPEIGKMLHYNAPDGQKIPGRIVEIRKDAVVVDFNYPLAGKTLHYDAEVLDVR